MASTMGSNHIHHGSEPSGNILRFSDDDLYSTDWNSLFITLNTAITIAFGILLFSYRMLLKLPYLQDKRLDILLFVKMAVGWIVGYLFFNAVGLERQCVITLLSIFTMMLGTGPDCIAIFFGLSWFTAVIIGSCIAYCTASAHESILYVYNVYFTACGAILSSLCLLMVRPIFMNWEIVVLPLLTATGLLTTAGLPLLIWTDGLVNLPKFNIVTTLFGDDQTDSERKFHLELCWIVLYCVAFLIQSTTYISGICGKEKTGHSSSLPNVNGRRNPIDLNSADGGQNDLLRRLLLNQEINRTEMFESRFPMISSIGQTQEEMENRPLGTTASAGLDMNDESEGITVSNTRAQEALQNVINFQPTPSVSGGMVERAREMGLELTENQKKILEICQTDEVERDRILFGGGLW